MQIDLGIAAVIIGAAIVTFLPRVLPLMLLSRMELPGWAMRWLHYVPVAVMAALVGQELLLQDGELALLHNPKLLAALPAVIVAIVTRSLLGTVVVGIAAMMVLRLWM